MSRLNAAGLNFTERGQAWDHFWLDGGPNGPADAVAPPGTRSEAEQHARRNKQSGFVETACNIALLALAAAVVAVPRAPLITQQARSRTQELQSGQNLVILRQTAPLPFVAPLAPDQAARRQYQAPDEVRNLLAYPPAVAALPFVAPLAPDQQRRREYQAPDAGRAGPPLLPKPFAASEADPRPRRAAQPADEARNLLTGTPAAATPLPFVAPLPPEQAKRRATPLEDALRNLLAYPPAVIVDAVFRAPLITQQGARRAQPVEESRNLAILQPAAAVALPFVAPLPPDQPKRRAAQPVETAVNAVLLQVQYQNYYPQDGSDWQQPRRRRVVDDFSAPNLVIRLVAAVTPPFVAPLEPEQAKRRAAQQVDDARNLLTGTPAAAAPLPFVAPLAQDQPKRRPYQAPDAARAGPPLDLKPFVGSGSGSEANYRPRRAAQQVDEARNLLTGTPAATVALPFVSVLVDQPPAKHRQADEASINLVVRATFTFTPPFLPSTYEHPARRHPQDADAPGWNLALGIGVSPGVAQPFGPRPATPVYSNAEGFLRAVAGSPTRPTHQEAPRRAAGSASRSGSSAGSSSRRAGVNPAPILVSVVSRKTHGGAGDFDITLDMTALIGGAITVEPRDNSVAHRIVFTFDRAITVAGTPTSVDSLGNAFGTPSAAAVGNTVIVSITGAPDRKRAVISLAGVNSNASASINVGFLRGDVTNSRTVNSTDISQIAARNGQSVAPDNTRYDIDLDGTVTSPTGDRAMAALNSLQSI